MASMLKLKGLLTKIVQMFSKSGIKQSFSGKSVSYGSWTSVASITLPANGTYMVVAQVNCGALSGSFGGGYYSARTAATGSPLVSYNATQKAHSESGGGANMTGIYRTGSSSITVSAEMYLYGSNTTSAANGVLIAVPIPVGGAL